MTETQFAILRIETLKNFFHKPTKKFFLYVLTSGDTYEKIR